MRRGKVTGLLRACHPAPTAVVTTAVCALALTAGRAAGTALVGAAMLTGQLSIGWGNDLIDRERDRGRRRDKPLAAGEVSAPAVAVAAGLALVACVPLSLANGWRAGVVHLVAVAAAHAYNLGVKATAWSFTPYTLAFGLVPAYVTLGLPGHPWPAWWATVAGALLGTGAHFANTAPDIVDDLATGVRGLPQRLGPCRARATASALFVTASAVLAFAGGNAGPLAVAGFATAVAVSAVAVVAGRHARWSGRHATILITAVLACLDLALLIGRGGRMA